MGTHLGWKPDWGRLTVRNFREGAENVTMGAGLRPPAKALDTPPDPTVGAPALYPKRVFCTWHRALGAINKEQQSLY